MSEIYLARAIATTNAVRTPDYLSPCCVKRLKRIKRWIKKTSGLKILLTQVPFYGLINNRLNGMAVSVLLQALTKGAVSHRKVLLNMNNTQTGIVINEIILELYSDGHNSIEIKFWEKMAKIWDDKWE